MGLNRMTIHWTAGSYGQLYLNHYHCVVDHLGVVHLGRPPEYNLPEGIRRGEYAAHCGGGNTGNIGISMAAMAGYKSPSKPGSYPITRRQFEAMCKQAARYAIKYNIPNTPEHIFTHYEFGKRFPKTTSAGKIDIVYLPPFPWLKPNEVGDFIRNKIQWYINKERIQ